MTLYLTPALMGMVLPKLLGELRPGARIVSHAFTLADWPPDRVVPVTRGDGRTTRVYLWIVPETPR